jgi:uridine kinase
VTYLSHDSYYRDLTHLSHDERAQQNFDHPDALETELLVQHLQQLKNGQNVEIPEYDFATHSRKRGQKLAVPRKVILVEGILIFHSKEVMNLLDIKIFVDTDADIRFIRRLQRDLKERGRSAECVIDQYVNTVRPMHMQFVEPSKLEADIIVPYGLNPVALDLIMSRLHFVTESH